MITADPRPELPPATVAVAGSRYAGLATRALAFAVDAAIINAVAWFVGLVVAVCLSLFKVPDDVKVVLVALGGALALLWAVAYFTFFWSTTAQTPGSRLLRIEVRTAGTDEVLRARRALARVLLLPLSVIPLFAGVLLILVDGRRRALHDCLVGSVVTYAPETTRSPTDQPVGIPTPRHST
jgi:uncharacterized RDD family membrane protein YckC